MSSRPNPFFHQPGPMQGLVQLDREIVTAGHDVSLVELINIRASQINACAYCLHMHTADALAHGEDAKRIFLLDAFEESALFSKREKAALRWTEVVTRIDVTHASDDEYARLNACFTDEEIVKLTLVIGMINVWNRLCSVFRSQHQNDTGRLEDAPQQS